MKEKFETSSKTVAFIVQYLEVILNSNTYTAALRSEFDQWSYFDYIAHDQVPTTKCVLLEM